MFFYTYSHFAFNVVEFTQIKEKRYNPTATFKNTFDSFISFAMFGMFACI